MKIINGKGAVLGRLASYAAKEALKGEDIIILNSEQVIITGNRKNIKERFHERRLRVGSGQKGPKISRNPEKIVKRAIRGMISNHRKGHGKIAFNRIKCYVGIPKEFEDKKYIVSGKTKNTKFIQVKDITK
jgi:large subunit ribosomal protein L13